MMASFEVVFLPSVHKDLRRLPKSAVAEIMARIENLAIDPLPAGVVKIVSAERLYRVRVRAYRIVYELDGEARQVIIHYVRHRREVYRRR